MNLPLKYNLRNLLERKGSTAMTALGIGLTVAVLITAFALTTGLKTVFGSTGNPLQLLVLRDGANAELTSQVAEESYQIIRRLPGIATTADGTPMVSPEGLTVVNLPSVDNPEGMNVTVRGMLPIGVAMRNPTVVAGEMLKPGLRQIVVGSAIAKRYPSARIGKKVRFGRGYWTVVGVFSAGDSAANSEIWTDLNQLRGDFEVSGGSSSVLLRAKSPADMAAIKSTIDGDRRLNAQAMPEKEYYASLTSGGLPLQILGFSVAIIMAVGSAFAATNTMYAAVSRRTREVGTLRALGFPRTTILLSFVVESVCLALLGGCLGVLLALPINGLTTGVGNFQTFNETTFQFRVTPAAALYGLLFAVAIGALGGFLPAWSASRKPIVQAMRDA
ncbi:MAG TPA: FtsX-like permease family protein [Phycisphaerae bacterium]|nr:FtsX-like permease family protein [Phycisphaerae bacterium]